MIRTPIIVLGRTTVEGCDQRAENDKETRDQQTSGLVRCTVTSVHLWSLDLGPRVIGIFISGGYIEPDDVISVDGPLHSSTRYSGQYRYDVWHREEDRR